MAAFEAWAHECGLDHVKMARRTPQELSRLQLGWAIREHGVNDQTGTESRKAQMSRRHQEKTDRMFEELKRN